MFFYENKYELGIKQFVIEEKEDFSYPLHMHRYFELVLVTEGCINIKIASHEYLLKNNEAVLIFPNQLHSFSSTEHSKHKLCIFMPELIMYYSKKVKNLKPADNHLDLNNNEWLELFSNFNNDTSTEKAKGILYYFCGLFKENNIMVQIHDTDTKKEFLLSDMFNYINKNYTNACTLKTAADALNYDYYYLSKFFIENIGLSFNEYINMLRIELACYHLKNNSEPIINISTMCGYTNLRSFNRNFKKYSKLTPKEYRNL